MSKSLKLSRSWYQRDDAVALAQKLLGKVLMTRINGQLTGGIIVETEAYQGATDKACHAYGNRRTTRTEVMFAPGGLSYVYLCYGMHHLFNIITNIQDTPDAVLVRGIAPLVGIETMCERRKLPKLQPRVSAGPALVSQSLGLTRDHNALDLTANTVWIEDRGIEVKPRQIRKGPRVGVDYAGEHAKLPWRFSIKDNPYVSKAK